MWTPETRKLHDRSDLRYGSDLTDEELQLLEPLLPSPAATGRPWNWPLREMTNAIFYVLRSGCPWRLLPAHFPPHQTTYGWFVRLRDAGSWESLNQTLLMRDRERVGREASPSAAVIDCQSVTTTESWGQRGYDAGKKIKGRKRHALVDTDRRALVVQVTPLPRRIVTAPYLCFTSRAGRFLSSNASSPTAPIKASAWPTRRGSSSRSSTNCPTKSGLRCCRAAGWSNDSSPGSTGTGASPRILRGH